MLVLSVLRLSIAAKDDDYLQPNQKELYRRFDSAAAAAAAKKKSCLLELLKQVMNLIKDEKKREMDDVAKTSKSLSISFLHSISP